MGIQWGVTEAIILSLCSLRLEGFCQDQLRALQPGCLYYVLTLLLRVHLPVRIIDGVNRAENRVSYSWPLDDLLDVPQKQFKQETPIIVSC